MKNGNRKSITGNGGGGGRYNPDVVKRAASKLRGQSGANGEGSGIEPPVIGKTAGDGIRESSVDGDGQGTRSVSESSGNGISAIPGSGEGSGNGTGAGTGTASDSSDPRKRGARAGAGASQGTEPLGENRGQNQFNLNMPPEPAPKRRGRKPKAEPEKTIQEVQAEIATLSGMLGAVLNASFYAVSLSQGEHWRLQPEETFQLSTGMTLAIKSSFPESWLMQYEKALSTYAPWVSVIITAGSIINKRIELGRIIATESQGSGNSASIN